MPAGLAQLLSRLRGHRGVALVAVLWVLTILSLVAASFMRTTRTEINLTYNLVENAKAEALADAGVHQAIYEVIRLRQGLRLSPGLEQVLESQPGLEAGMLEQLQKKELQEAQDEPETSIPLDGTPFEWRYKGATLIIGIQDETAKIDLNYAAPDLLRGLFMVVGAEKDEATALADAVGDFRDPDDARSLHGAEDDDYAAADMEWDAKDAPFASVDELQQVLGMTPALYRAVRPAVTVYSKRPQITEANAPPLVQATLLGLVDLEAAQAVLGTSVTDEEVEGLADTLLPDDAQARIQQGDAITTDIVSIRSEAVTETGAHFVREAVVRLTLRRSELFRIEDWRQGRREVERPDTPADIAN